MTDRADTGARCTNPFVARLIRLQQDGKEAISGPSNWREPPLLEVVTEPGDVIDELIASMSPGGDAPRRGRWHWLIGSPRRC